jgi:phage I-like protein
MLRSFMSTALVGGSDETLTLRDIPADVRKKAKASDFAGKNRSFPILKPEDVKAAAASIGRAGADNYSTDELKRRIIRIAKRKGAAFVAQLPAAWKGDGEKKAAAIQLPGQAITLAADDTGEGPATTWIQVLRVGKFWSPKYKDFAVTKATLATMVENFKTVTPKPPTEFPLDYNHGTNRPATVEQGKAAGWIKDVELRANDTELWAQVELTEQAADLVRNKEYRFVSATFEFDHVHSEGPARKKNIGATLMAAALTNTPFVEGMQPVTLGREAAIALADDEAAEESFSYDEQRRRVADELRECYGVNGCGPCCGPYLIDMFDGYVIYREGDSADTYRVDYSIAADGSVTFTSDPVEVRVAYEPLPQSAAGETEMATIKVKDAKGAEIELSEETVKELAKIHAPRPAAGDTTRLDEAEIRLTKAETEIVELTAKNVALENEKKETAAKTKVDALIRAGKIMPKQREHWVKLALADRDTFKTLTDGLPVSFHYNERQGTSEDAEATSAVDEVTALARNEMDKDAKLSLADATSRVFQKNPALYERYKAESAVKV